MNNFRWRSLQTRLTLFTLAIFLLGMGSLACYASRMLREDRQRQLSEQQFSTVSRAAAELNQALDERLRALEKVAAGVSPALLRSPQALQASLEDHPLLRGLFNAGIAVLGPDGRVRAELAHPTGRIGVSDLGLDDAAAAALQQGRATVGRPIMSQALTAPAFALLVPIRNAQGQVTGALAGAVDLGQPNFLDKVTQSRYGKTGGYILVAPQYRLIVTATDRSRVMTVFPAAGIYPAIDRFMGGYEGSSTYVNPLGVEVLASARGVPAAGWFVGAILPTEEAFAPIQTLQQRMLQAALFVTLVAGGLMWWMLRRQLAPVLAAAKTLGKLSPGQQRVPALPSGRADEIGDLITSFNRLLASLGQREESLRETKRFLKESQIIAGLGSYVLDIGSGAWKSSDVFDQLFGIAPAWERDLAGWVRLIHPDDRAMLADYLRDEILGRGQVFDREYRIVRQDDGACRWVHGLGKLEFDARGQPRCLRGTIQDISAQKQAGQLELFRSHSLELLATGAPLPELLDAIARGTEQLLSGPLCSIVLADREDPHPDLDAGWTPGWSQPIRTASGQLLGSFAVYPPQGHTPTDSDLAIVEQSAHLVRIALEKNLAAEQLHDSEERYRTLVERSPEPILVHRLGQILYVNAAAVALFGARQADALVGRLTTQLIHPDFLDVQLARMKQLNDRVPIQPRVESRFLRIDGSAVDVEVQGTAIVYDGQAAIQVSVRDITERKQAQETLRLSASVFTHAREGIMITAANGAIIDVNESFTRITGYHREEVLGRNPRLLSSGRQGQELYAAMWRGLVEKGHWYGEIWNRRKSGELYAAMQTISAVRDARGITQQYVALFSDITAIKEHQKQLEHIAHYDALTSLPNRLLLADRLQQGLAQAQRRGQRLAVAFLDLDGFKSVNDKHGHEAGDQLLIILANRMKQALRDGDTLARLGGDEFVAVLGDLDSIEASLPMLTRLLASAAQPVQFGEQLLQVSASLGVTFYPQAEEVEADQLLRQADQAMYQAKLAGKNRYHFFDAEQDRSVRGHHESRERIRSALAAHEFVLHYQPKVNMRSGAVIGVEALIRWQHPQNGLLLPAVFLPVIEDHPLAIDIGEWVISTALSQIEAWQALGLALPVSVNVGARQLQQSDFVQRLQALLAAHPGLQPGDLALEVQESSALEDVVGIAGVIEACREIGVLCALDDFGTGYSSLTYLKRLPVTLLKIDQSFVCNMPGDPGDLAILEGVMGLAHAFRRQVIAEGVETVAQGSLLLQLGCELAQGHGIGHPQPGDAIPDWVARWQPDPAWTATAPLPLPA